MLVQVALAGAISVPIFFREQAHNVIRRVRGKLERTADSCPLPRDADDES